jgi:eukaryotic-like serine/threonine-protein kinase
MLVCNYCHLVLPNNESVCALDGGRGVDFPQEPLEAKLTERFKNLEPFARGQTGCLYRAQDLLSGRQGLLKVLKFNPGKLTTKWSRIVRDLDKQKSLTDQHVAVVYDASDRIIEGEGGNCVWLFRPYLNGEPLSVRLKKEHTLKIPDALAITAQIATGLDAIHRAGLLHRDLKPGHIILRSQSTGVPFVTVIDTGIAAPIEAKSLFDLVGTAAYVSPEHAAGKAVSFRSDLYALGCIFYEILTGEPPFAGRETDELLRSHKEQPFEPLQLQLPEPIAALASSLLAKDPRERPFSAQQVRRTLEPFLPESTPAVRATQSTVPRAPAVASVAPPTNGRSKPPRSSVPAPPRTSKSSRRSIPVPPASSVTRASLAPLKIPTPNSLPVAKIAIVETSLDDLIETVGDEAGLNAVELPVATKANAKKRTLPPPQPVASPTGRRSSVPPPRPPIRILDPEDVDLVEEESAPNDASSIPAGTNGGDVTTIYENTGGDAIGEEDATRIMTHRDVGMDARASFIVSGDKAAQEATILEDEPTGVVKATDDGTTVRIDKIGDDAKTSRFDRSYLASLISPTTGAVDQSSSANYAMEVSPGSNEISKPPRQSGPALRSINSDSVADAEKTLVIQTNNHESNLRKAGVVAATAIAAAMVVYAALRWSEPGKVTVSSTSLRKASTAPTSKTLAVVRQDKPTNPEALSVVPRKGAQPTTTLTSQPSPIDTPTNPVPALTAAAKPAEINNEPQAKDRRASAESEKDSTVSNPKNGLKAARGRGISNLSSGAPLGNRSDQVTALKQKARDHFQARRYSAAAAAYKEATRLSPGDAGAYAGLGASLLAVNDSNGAIAAYQRAIQLSPKSSGYHAALGRTYFSNGDKARAIKAYRKALEIDPNNQVARMALQRLAR